MKFCPECGNKGFTPSDKFSKPLINKGKQNYKKFSIRYYACINCGARFKTIEKFHESVDKSGSLFDEQPEKAENVEG